MKTKVSNTNGGKSKLLIKQPKTDEQVVESVLSELQCWGCSAIFYMYIDREPNDFKEEKIIELPIQCECREESALLSEHIEWVRLKEDADAEMKMKAYQKGLRKRIEDGPK